MPLRWYTYMGINRLRQDWNFLVNTVASVVARHLVPGAPFVTGAMPNTAAVQSGGKYHSPIAHEAPDKYKAVLQTQINCAQIR
jgi:hypothetical protein